MKVLVVDDNDDSRIYLERGLRSQGYSVKTARNGKDALESTKTWNPELIITDILMPEMDGFELCRRITEDKSLCGVPIIVYTATFIDSRDEKLSLSLGASRFVIKPIDFSELIEIINEVMEESEAHQLPVTATTVEEKQNIVEEYHQALARKLDKKVRELEEERCFLKASEEKYRRLIETAPDTIICDINGIITEWNRSAEKIFGYTKSEIIGKPVSILMDDKFKKVHKEGLEQALVTDKSGNVGKRVEVSGIMKKGTSVPIEISLNAQMIDNERSRVTMFIRDITERKKADEQICRLSHAIEQSSSTIFITDTKGNIEYANSRFTQLTGYTPEEAIGKNPRVLKSGKTSSEVYKELWQIITSGNEWRGEFCNRKKNGELYWEAASISPVKNDEGKITNFIAVKDDITERKQSERRLNAQHEVTKVLVESSTIKEASRMILQAICTALEWDIGEIWEFDQQKMALYNTAIWHMPSFKAPEFKTATGQITFSPKIGLPDRVWESADPLWIPDIVHDTSFIRASVADKEGLHGAFGFPIIIGSDVRVVLCFYSREIRKPDMNFLDMMTAIGRQIGLFIKRKQAEEMLLQSEKLKSLGTITAGVSHDFNNILAIISGRAQLLEEDYESNKELTDGLSIIMKAIDDGVEISNRMLKFTKTEKDTTGFVSYDIRDLLMESIDFTMPRWKSMAQAKGINYHLDKESIKEVPAILCNPTELREVFINIINNALDAMPEGGNISFSTWSDDDTVFVDISDTGEGMPEDVKKRIFDPFFSTKGAKGTGLGMSMTYAIVTSHGGKIEVKSKVGRGSTFKLQFSITTKTVRSIATPEPEQEIKNKCLRILVVDDEEVICNILDKFLSRGGHNVKTVNNGADAIELMKRDGFDLVLCDLAMPDVFGYDVIKALNGLEKRPKIGIITGWGEKLKAIEEEGVEVDFIAKKPFVFSELTRKINEAFDTE